MPPRNFSRHIFSTALSTPEGNRELTLPDPYAFASFDDTRRHVVQQGDNLQSIAARYYEGFNRPESLWWIVGEFQPDPIFDPTVELEVGRVILVPSLRTVYDSAFSEERREIAEVT